MRTFVTDRLTNGQSESYEIKNYFEKKLFRKKKLNKNLEKIFRKKFYEWKKIFYFARFLKAIFQKM